MTLDWVIQQSVLIKQTHLYHLKFRNCIMNKEPSKILLIHSLYFKYLYCNCKSHNIFFDNDIVPVKELNTLRYLPSLFDFPILSKDKVLIIISGVILYHVHDINVLQVSGISVLYIVHRNACLLSGQVSLRFPICRAVWICLQN